MRHLASLLFVPTLLLPIGSAADPTPERQTQLLRVLYQDCGSCHGMRMTGGLGPALTAEALRERPLQSLVATIYHGRPGTAMPGWKSMLTLEEADWLAVQLLNTSTASELQRTATTQKP